MTKIESLTAYAAGALIGTGITVWAVLIIKIAQVL